MQEFLLQRCRSFVRREDGSIGLAFAIGLLAAIGLMGLAIDFGRVAAARQELQSSLDASVLAGVSATSDERIATANSFFEKNHSPQRSTAQPIVFTSNGSNFGATANADVKMAFAQIFGLNTLRISASSTAAGVASSARPCILALDPSARDAFYFDSQSLFRAPNCEVHVRSSNMNAAYLKSLSQVTIKKICVNGGAYGDSFANLQSSCAASSDPYVNSLPAIPLMDPCVTINSNQSYSNGTVSPGTYCGITTFGGGSTLTMRAGVYVIRSASSTDGLLKLSAKKIVVTPYGGSDGVTFFIADEKVGMSLSTKENASIKAPTTGAYAGWLLFQQPGLLGTKTVTLGSADKTQLKGIFYAPTWNLRLDSFSDWSDFATSNLNIVVNKFYAHSLSHVAIEPADQTTTSTATAKRLSR